jgi:hypothetical protein
MHPYVCIYIYIYPMLLTRLLGQRFTAMALLYSYEMTIFLDVVGTGRGAIDFEELCAVDSSGQLDDPVQLKTDVCQILATWTLYGILDDHPKLAELAIKQT